MDFLSDMFGQQQSMNDPMAMMDYQMQGMYGVKPKKTTRKDVLMWLQQQSNASEVVQIDDFETPRMRHICRGTKIIKILEKRVVEVPVFNETFGHINVEYFLCEECRKLILNKGSLEMY